MDIEDIYILVRARFEGLVPQNKVERFDKWLISDKYCKEKDEALKLLWDTLPTSYDENAAETVSQMTGILRETHTRPLLQRLRYVAAAAIILLITSTATWYISSNYYNNGAELQTLVAAYSEVKKVVLSDGTTVRLNSGSTLTYPKRFNGKERKVVLQGEGFFDVARDEAHPFIVSAGELNVKVLGTKFNMRGYADDDCITATLVEGSILAYDDYGRSVRLKPNMQVKFNKITNQIETNVVEAKESTLWQNGDLILSKVTIKELGRALERRFKVKTIISDDINDNERYTMNFKAYEKLNNVLDILSQTSSDIKCLQRGDTVFITKKGGTMR